MAAVVLSAALTLPIHAHTVTELQQWEADWATRANVALTPALYSERDDMVSRHSWFFFPQPEEVSPTEPRTGDAVATPPSASSSMGNGNVEQWRTLVAAYFPPEEVDRALRIMACESGGNPNAYNPSGASGLMQVLASWADNFGLVPSQLFDPATNLQVARYLWDDGGWGHWVCR